ncbi:cytochrome P450 [Aspergillus lucknowensis]|uniref:Cytochrome P450 n=1 Tax=Aspergillus lucknowensis TaxID=176173 RepID=A0ABR4M3J6_9EURO
MLAIALLLPLSVIALLLYTVGRYFRDPKRLRRFPAPSVAALTPLWGMWHSWTGRQYKAIDAAHKRLGPVVRIAPNHVSFTDPAAYKDIYGHGMPLVKDDFYAHIAAGNPSIAQATDKAVHSGKRRSLAHIFSAREIGAMEPRVMKCVMDLCEAVRVKVRGGQLGPEDAYPVAPEGDGAFDVRPWLNMFAYDAITSMLFTNSYGFLKKGNDLCPSADENGVIRTVHGMDSFHSASRFNTILAQLPGPLYTLGRKILFFDHGNQAGSAFAGMARAQVLHRVENQPEQPDLFSFFPITPTEKRPHPMPISEVVAECVTMMDAGNDTTQTTLTNAMYLLAANPEKQEKLYAALAAAIPADYREEPLKVLPSAILKDVPYLRAVLEENWRCRPPVARGLPRRTTGEGSTIGGHFIPGGVTVSAPIHVLHRDEGLFRRPLEFIPERWLPGDDELEKDEKEAQNLKNFCIAFSLGARACIGRNLAYMEVSIVIAALVLNFEWELAEPGSAMETVERFNCNPKELMVRAKLRYC